MINCHIKYENTRMFVATDNTGKTGSIIAHSKWHAAERAIYEFNFDKESVVIIAKKGSTLNLEKKTVKN